jgi:hypothetical protein
VVCPVVEVKPVESDSLYAYRYLGKQRADFGIEAIAINAQVVGRVTQSDEAGE